MDKNEKVIIISTPTSRSNYLYELYKDLSEKGIATMYVDFDSKTNSVKYELIPMSRIFKFKRYLKLKRKIRKTKKRLTIKIVCR